jgi:hypothetical protein
MKGITTFLEFKEKRKEKVGGSVLQSVRELSWVPREFKVQIDPCTKR